MSFPDAYCCDPLKRHPKRKRRYGLRPASAALASAHPSLCLTSINRLCTGCRKQLYCQSSAATLLDDTAGASTAESVNIESENLQASSPDIIESENLQASSPEIEPSGSHDSDWQEDEEGTLHSSSSNEVDMESQQSDESEIIMQLKEKFNSSVKRSEKLRILTVLPKSWSLKKTMQVFGVTKYMAKQAKKLVQEKGVLSSPNPKAGKSLSRSTEEQVTSFYRSDEISRMMPGKKDTVSVVTADGKRVSHQKRLLLCNLKEAYEQFKMHNPEVKIGFSKFAELRPKECILAGAAGTHSVCVCTLHQNTKLMLAGSKLEALTGGELKHYGHCLAAIQCNPPRIECYLGECSECPNADAFKERLQGIMDAELIDTVEFRQWTSTDRATLETRIVPVDEFLDLFVGMLKKLKYHDFIAKTQAKFMKDTKQSLKPGEYLVIADFSENFSFIVQDEVQSFHWNNNQATIHPFVCYYMDSGKLSNLCFIVIAESREHDTIAVHLFQRKLIEFLTMHSGEKPKRICYMSDRCAAQYKNRKNFLNLCNHFADFGVQAEWHFFATSHGKSAGDGAGGTLKRLATKASLQRIYSGHILTPHDLYKFAVEEIKGMHFAFATCAEYEYEAQNLQERLKHSRTIPGTHQIHCAKPISADIMEVSSFSTSSNSRREKTTSKHHASHIQITAITGYVTVNYNGSCWLGYAKSVDHLEQTVTVMFLHPCIPSPSFIYPSPHDIMDVDPSDILSKVNPVTATGRTYTLTKKEILEATRLLAERQ